MALVFTSELSRNVVTPSTSQVLDNPLRLNRKLLAYKRTPDRAYGRGGGDGTQSRQSAKLFLQSSELGLKIGTKDCRSIVIS